MYSNKHATFEQKAGKQFQELLVNVLIKAEPLTDNA